MGRVTEAGAMGQARGCGGVAGHQESKALCFQGGAREGNSVKQRQTRCFLGAILAAARPVFPARAPQRAKSYGETPTCPLGGTSLPFFLFAPDTLDTVQNWCQPRGEKECPANRDLAGTGIATGKHGGSSPKLSLTPPSPCPSPPRIAFQVVTPVSKMLLSTAISIQ